MQTSKPHPTACSLKSWTCWRQAERAQLNTSRRCYCAKPDDDIVLVPKGQSKEAIGVELTHDQVKHLTDKDVERYYKRYVANEGTKTTENLIQSFLLVLSKGSACSSRLTMCKHCRKASRKTTLLTKNCLPWQATWRCGAAAYWPLPSLLYS